MRFVACPVLCCEIPSVCKLSVLMLHRHSEDGDLNVQIDLFDDIRRQDDEEMSVPGGIDVDSHLDMFNAVFCKVSSCGGSVACDLHEKSLCLDK